VPNGDRIETSATGSQTFQVTATDAAGNTATKQVVYNVGPDTTNPTITITSPAANATYTKAQPVTAQYACSDTGGSGLASCNGPVAPGAPINTSQEGSFSFKVDARDGAGNTASKTVAYTVQSAPSPGDCTGYYALTFDDGPNATYTPQVKAALDSLGVKATFFLVGQEVDARPDLVRLVANAGHWVGNHSYTHADLTTLSSTQASSEMSRTNDAILSATGIRPQFARPPYGEFNDQTLSVFRGLGLENAFWTIDTNDWAGPSVSAIVNEAVKVQPGGIILMHDANPNTVTAVPQIVNQLKQRGMCAGKLAVSPTPVEAVPAWPGVFFSVVAVRP
jgi:peptidoglycan/xylan/chitin deacetylase (PgdA/CDA1 family)